MKRYVVRSPEYLVLGTEVQNRDATLDFPERTSRSALLESFILVFFRPCLFHPRLFNLLVGVRLNRNTVLLLEPTPKVDLPASIRAERHGRGGVGGNGLSANRTAKLSHNGLQEVLPNQGSDFVLFFVPGDSDFFDVFFSDEVPLSDLLSVEAGSLDFLSASAAFLYESLR